MPPSDDVAVTHTPAKPPGSAASVTVPANDSGNASPVPKSASESSSIDGLVVLVASKLAQFVLPLTGLDHGTGCQLVPFHQYSADPGARPQSVTFTSV